MVRTEPTKERPGCIILNAVEVRPQIGIGTLALLLILAACQSPTGEAKAPSAAADKLITSDGISLAYSYLPARAADAQGVILLHMLGRSKEDYDAFAKGLNAAGFAVIAIDFRGHGESDGNVQEFTEQDFQDLVKDVKAAKDFLAEEGVTKIGIVGASIGANVALQYAVTDPAVAALVLLSPGLNYRGVTTEDVMPRYNNPVYLLAAEDDRDSAIATKRLEELAHISLMQVYPRGGHGTRLFTTTRAERSVIEWLEHYLVRGAFK